ncbi:MAG: nickel transporter permease [Pseudomonadota bacterium]
MSELTRHAPEKTGLRAWLLAEAPTSPSHATLQRAYLSWLAFSANPIAMTGLAIILTLVLAAVFAPWLTATDGVVQSLSDRLSPPSAEHWLGTDQLGRDILDRIIWGSRITLYIVALTAAIVVPVGLGVGVLAGYVGGIVDVALMRLVDVFLAFPRLILALAFVSALGPGIENAVLAIAITSWAPYARIARAEAMRLRNAEFILAAQVQGASTWRILRRYLVPLCMPSVIVRLTLDMAGVILIAAGLGFLGLGAQPPSPEWGAMISSGRQYLLDQWWVPTVPGLAILLVSLGFNLLGDGLRDVLDPKAGA